jgi:O-antigen ligase
MPPALALILCTAFVAYLLLQEHRFAPEVSPGLWLPTLWMLYSFSKPLASWFDAGGESMESGSPLDRNFLLLMFIACISLLNRRGCNPVRAIARQPWLLGIILYMLASVLWSDIPFISLKRWIREALAVLVALIVATDINPRGALFALLRRSVYTLIPYSVLLIKYYPSLGVQYGRWSGKQMWVGVASQKNGLGLLCLVSAFFLIWSLVREPKGPRLAGWNRSNSADVLVLLLCGWLLKSDEGAYSATSLASLAAGFALFGTLLFFESHHWRIPAPAVAAGLAAAFAVGASVPFLGVPHMSAAASALGRDETLTGRTDIWNGLMQEVSEHPLLGWGVGGFWTTDKAELHSENSAHSGYLETLLNLGLVGLALFAAYLLSCSLSAVRFLRSDFAYATLWLCCLLMTILHNTSESSLPSFTYPLTALLLVLSVIPRAGGIAATQTIIVPRATRTDTGATENAPSLAEACSARANSVPGEAAPETP